MAAPRTALALMLALKLATSSEAKSLCTPGEACTAGTPVLLQKYSRVDGSVQAKEDEETLHRNTSQKKPTLSIGLGPVTDKHAVSSLSRLRMLNSTWTFGPAKGAMWRPVHWGHELPMPQDWGGRHLFTSAEVFDWTTFACVCVVAVVTRPWLHRKTPEDWVGGHFLAFLTWLSLAAIFAVAIYWRFGEEKASDWLAGYQMEMFFMVENVFVFRSVIQALELPDDCVAKTLNLVSWGQIAFEAVFFMGLAHQLRTWRLLPHVLGFTLLYFGTCTLIDAFEHSEHAAPSTPSPLTRTIIKSSSFGNLVDDTRVRSFFVHKEGSWRLSLVGLALCLLLTTDFMFEIDTVLTKVEEIRNPFIAFSSSALAAFALPELYMLSQDALLRFPLLEFGIGLVLCMFGVMMLLAPVIVLHPLATCMVMFGILLTSMLLSDLNAYFRPQRCWSRVVNHRE
eukprot:TRINITY_DN37034_c0_g1_i1.p1 TRINITY_DN37034_c0_g1~~TRINITY_DN37034_c0_g1_i1.p1  ORF type:complete len:451 (-),score=74.52 TRINITY_DN37034_c0_g1_i1:322-1674(-)